MAAFINWPSRIHDGLELLHVPNELPVGPQNAVGDFISNLDVIRHRPRGCEGGDGVAVVSAHLLYQLGKVQVGPGGGRGLMTGVGPGVGIMKIQHEQQSGILDPHSQRHGVAEVVGVIVRIICRHLASVPVQSRSLTQLMPWSLRI